MHACRSTLEDPTLFTQLDRKTQDGLGIGLTLVKTIVERHGGVIEARSGGAGKGSEFVVRLPLTSGRTATHGVESPPLRRARPGLPRVLVVDDNRDAAESLATLLEILGAEVHMAADGAAAFSALETYRPEVVLLDIGMPGMDGYEVARRIRERPDLRELTLIALTGWGKPEDVRRSREAGFDYHLVKPADIATLESLLRSSRGHEFADPRVRASE